MCAHVRVFGCAWARKSVRHHVLLRLSLSPRRSSTGYSSEASRPRSHRAVLAQLRSQFWLDSLRLNDVLRRFGRAPSAICPACLVRRHTHLLSFLLISVIFGRITFYSHSFSSHALSFLRASPAGSSCFSAAARAPLPLLLFLRRDDGIATGL